MDFSIDVVHVALEHNLQEGEDKSEEHPNLHHLHAARLGQRVWDADKPEPRGKLLDLQKIRSKIENQKLLTIKKI